MYYVFAGVLTSLSLVVKSRAGSLENEIRLYKVALNWFDNTKNPIPAWYLKDFYIQWIDGVPYVLKKPFNFFSS